MTDLRTLLDDAAGPAAPVAPTVVEADLARGHRALRRHRAKTLGVRGGLVAALALGAVAVTGGTGLLTDPSPSADPTRPAPTATTVPTVTLAPTALVAYTGAQPEGYTLAKIPLGFRVASNQQAYLTLERADATGSDPALFDDKVAVEQSVDADPTGGDAVTVDGKPATIVHGNDASSLYLEQDNGSYLMVQAAKGLNWGNAQLIEFASGVTVTEDATLTYG